MDDRPLRVIQWATGNIGARAVRAVLEHPELELVGLWVHSAAKAGQDAAALCGLDADVVLYMPQGCDVEEACRDGGSSIHSTGSSPGFITEAVPMVLTSLERRLDHLSIEEYADMSRRPSPELIRFVATWWCTPIDADSELQSTGWRVRVDGGVPMDVRIEFDGPIEAMSQYSPGFTAHRAVNAIHAVHAAPPGIRATVELPNVVARRPARVTRRLPCRRCGGSSGARGGDRCVGGRARPVRRGGQQRGGGCVRRVSRRGRGPVRATRAVELPRGRGRVPPRAAVDGGTWPRAHRREHRVDRRKAGCTVRVRLHGLEVRRRGALRDPGCRVRSTRHRRVAGQPRPRRHLVQRCPRGSVPAPLPPPAAPRAVAPRLYLRGVVRSAAKEAQRSRRRFT